MYNMIKITNTAVPYKIEKTRDLFKKIRSAKGTFHAKIGTIKDRNGMDLTEAEDIKKRWQYIGYIYKTDFKDTDNNDGVPTQLEADILECEVKQVLGSITTSKANGGMKFQLSYLKS